MLAVSNIVFKIILYYSKYKSIIFFIDTINKIKEKYNKIIRLIINFLEVFLKNI